MVEATQETPAVADVAAGDDRWMDGPDVDAYLGITHSTRWRWLKEGRLPAPHRVSPKKLMWRKSSIDASIEDQRASA